MKYVIIGIGAAGMTAAKTLRELAPQDEIVMISAEEQPHSRCMLHKYLSHERDEDGLNFVPADFFEKNHIGRITGQKVTRLDAEEKNVYYGTDGSSVQYDKLLIATGAESFIPPVGALRTASNVYGLRHLSDAKAINERAQNSKKVVIIGSGLVGLDAAYGLLEQGKEITIVEMADRLNDGGNILQGMSIKLELERLGIRVNLSTRALEITADGVIGERGGSKMLFKADTIITAMGMRSRHDIADELRFCAPEFYQIGDCLTPKNIYEATRCAYAAAMDI